MRILLVEDTADLADAIQARLRQRGYSVTWAKDGQQGCDAALGESFELIILDVMLPKRDAFSILKEMRAAQSDTPVLIITARGDVDDKVKLLDLGADDYIVKPFDLRELEARIRALVRRRLGASESVVKFGPLALDLNLELAFLDSTPVSLGKQEFGLLKLLASRGGKPMSKAVLVDTLFGFMDAGSPNAIETLISRLRRKLSGTGISIETLRGVGYHLVSDVPPSQRAR